MLLQVRLAVMVEGLLILSSDAKELCKVSGCSRCCLMGRHRIADASASIDRIDGASTAEAVFERTQR